MPAASIMQPSYQQEEQNISNNHNGTFNAPSMVNPGTSTNKMLPHLIGPGSSPYNYPMVPEQKPFVQVRIIYRLSGQQCFFHLNLISGGTLSRPYGVVQNILL